MFDNFKRLLSCLILIVANGLSFLFLFIKKNSLVFNTPFKTDSLQSLTFPNHLDIRIPLYNYGVYFDGCVEVYTASSWLCIILTSILVLCYSWKKRNTIPRLAAKYGWKMDMKFTPNDTIDFPVYFKKKYCLYQGFADRRKEYGETRHEGYPLEGDFDRVYNSLLNNEMWNKLYESLSAKGKEGHFYDVLEDTIVKSLFNTGLTSYILATTFTILGAGVLVLTFAFGVTMWLIPIWLVCMGFAMLTSNAK